MMEHELFNIGQAAVKSGISAKMIRHYEDVGLIPKASRTFSGYRLYNPRDIHMLRFICHSRDLGFSIKQISELVGLWNDKDRASSKVKALVRDHIIALDEKILSLNRMKTQLEHLASCCNGDSRPECPILEELSA